ncbi:MAG: hypothetical protein AAF628_02615 [Planctomycetota bacterium]
MSDKPDSQPVIRGTAVRRIDAPVVVDSSAGQGSAATMTVIPLMAGDRVEGFEVRCQCGTCVIVECVYEAEAQ